MNTIETWQSQRKPTDPDRIRDKTQFSSLQTHEIE